MNTSRLPIVWRHPLKGVHRQPAMIVDISCRGADDDGQDTGSDFGQQCEHLKSLRKIVFSDLDEGKFSTEKTVPITESYFRTWQAPYCGGSEVRFIAPPEDQIAGAINRADAFASPCRDEMAETRYIQEDSLYRIPECR